MELIPAEVKQNKNQFIEIYKSFSKTFTLEISNLIIKEEKAKDLSTQLSYMCELFKHISENMDNVLYTCNAKYGNEFFHLLICKGYFLYFDHDVINHMHSDLYKQMEKHTCHVIISFIQNEIRSFYPISKINHDHVFFYHILKKRSNSMHILRHKLFIIIYFYFIMNDLSISLYKKISKFLTSKKWLKIQNKINNQFYNYHNIQLLIDAIIWRCITE